MKYVFIHIIFILSILSCSNSSDQVSREQPAPTYLNNLKQAHVILKDSIEIKYSGDLSFEVDNPFNDLIVAYASERKSILVFDKNGELVTQLSEHTEVQGNDLDILSFGFIDTTKIAVLAEGGKITVYDIKDSNTVVETKIYHDSQYNPYGSDATKSLFAFNIRGKRNLLFKGAISTTGGMNSPEFYQKSKNIILFNIDDKSHINAVPFEQGGIYSNENRFLGTGHMPLPCVDYKNMVLKIIYPADKIIYEYAINDSLKLIRKLPLFPEKFNQPINIEFPYEQKETIDAILKLATYNAAYSKLCYKDSINILVYSTSVPVDVKYRSLPEAFELYKKHKKRMLEIYNSKTGKKLFHDIELPQFENDLISFKSLNEIYLMGAPKISSSTGKIINLIYVAKIVSD